MKNLNTIKNEFIAIYTDIESDKFGFGRVIVFDEQYLIINSVDPSGLEAGLTLYRIEDIFKIERNTLYIQKLFALMKYKQITLPEYAFSSDDYLIELLNMAQSTGTIVEFQLNHSNMCDVLGYVTELSGDSCTVNLIDLLGNEDGSCEVDLDNITSICYNDSDNRDIHILHLLKQGKA